MKVSLTQDDIAMAIQNEWEAALRVQARQKWIDVHSALHGMWLLILFADDFSDNREYLEDIELLKSISLYMCFHVSRKEAA
ncbi:MAG: hypothetical protein KZQ94_16110 [Candidatus Thiodiazotropha sp. (ex Troendleina suluensis)]|nr:hypothetical protein [Candidatus Thiodiazotropha sp. (ex Troendleina suluensis)]